MVPFLSGKDRILILELAKKPRFASWLSKDEWGWIHDHLRPDMRPPEPRKIEHKEEDADEDQEDQEESA